MGDLAPILVAIITSVGAIAAAALGARRWSKSSSVGDRSAMRWREQAELEKARADLLSEQLVDERAAHTETKAKLGDTRHDFDDCVRQRDNAYADLRALGRRQPRAGS